jgi:subtilase family serine protease
VRFAQGTRPAGGHPAWALEDDTDVQWAHVVAPQADILLVETAAGSLASLLQGVDLAVTQGSAVVSMSWVFTETTSELSNDVHFDHPGVAFFAASGNSGHGVHYPASSPFVLGVGGTRLSLDSGGNRRSPESAWSQSSGGISAVEPEPDYQALYPIPSTGGYRGTPDVAYDAAPATGVAVYDSIPRCTGCATGWFQVGGTSIGTPQWAALTALVDQARAAGRLSGNAPFYAAASADYAANYRDITAGSNGSCGTLCAAAAGYDFVSGLGSPHADQLVTYLVTH